MLRRAMQWLFDMTLGRAIDARVRRQRLYEPVVFGPPSRLVVARPPL
jgi:hypothetical protein